LPAEALREGGLFILAGPYTSPSYKSSAETVGWHAHASTCPRYLLHGSEMLKPMNWAARKSA
jgi:hypothetical protein